MSERDEAQNKFRRAGVQAGLDSDEIENMLEWIEDKVHELVEHINVNGLPRAIIQLAEEHRKAERAARVPRSNKKARQKVRRGRRRTRSREFL